MAWLALLLAVLMAVGAWRLMCPAPPSRPYRWLRRRTRALLDRGLDPARVADPFDALRLQTRLGVVARQIRDLEADPHVFAKVHRLEAARAAYDDLLEDACRLAGVPVGEDDLRGESRRWREERQLVERGWTW